jgi:hypothetical protein
MHLRTYRDENCSRHFDLISDGKRPRSIDLVLAITSGILVVGFTFALMIPFAPRGADLSAWVR